MPKYHVLRRLKTNKNSEKEDIIATVIHEPVVEETPQSNNELFSGYKLIELDGVDLCGYREL